MTEGENAAGRGPERRSSSGEHAPRPLLGPLVEALHPYRRVLNRAIGLAALFVVALGLSLWALYYPVVRRATLEFRVTFDGAEDGKYPNGSKFSAEDILSEPILRRAYDENDVKGYATFEKFHSAIYVTSSNRELELLELEYKGRLTDTKLQPIDRQRIEREFHEKAGALKNSTFQLTLIRSERLKKMDAVLMIKVLRGVLNAWADDAAKIRGVLKYDLPTYARTMIRKDEMLAEDYLIGVDMFRTKVNRTLMGVNELLKVPGIQLIRLPESGTTLPEIRWHLMDINAYRINTAFGLIRESHLSKDPPTTRRYIASRLFEASTDLSLAQETERKLRQAFDAYIGSESPAASRKGVVTDGSGGGGKDLGAGTVIPQLGESFIDRLMQLGNRNTDVGFRQELTERIITAGNEQSIFAKEVAFYKSLEVAYGNLTQNGRTLHPEAAQQVENTIAAAAEELGKALDDIQVIYGLISQRNLRPASLLYSVDAPAVIDSTSAFPLGRFLVLGVLFVVFAFGVTAVGALVHARLRARWG